MTTLLSSFDQALPDIKELMFGKQGKLKGSAHSSGSNTANCKPPDAAFQIPVEHWTGKADQLCLMDQNHRSQLQRGYMPGNEAAQLINSEEDVVNASALHFTHPVNTALSLVYPDDHYLCEATKGKDNTSGPTSSLGRVDRVYFKGVPADQNKPGHSNNTMACLEFKRAKALNAREFSETIVTSDEKYQAHLDAADENQVRYLQEEKNVSTILRQATHYAIKFKTPFVALFDYYTLILLVMTEVNEQLGHGGRFTYMTVVTDSKQLRKAFLGFLLCAHLDKEGNDSWKKARDGSDVLAKAKSLTAGRIANPSSSSSRPMRGPKKTYTERDSENSSESSSEGMDDAARKAAQTARGSLRPAAREGRKPSGLVKSVSSLSSANTSSVGSGKSTRSATTVSSTGSHGKSGKGLAAPAVATPAGPSGTKSANIVVRPKPIAAEKDAKPAALKKDAKPVASKKAAS